MFHLNLWPPVPGFTRSAVESMTSDPAPGDDVTAASRSFLSSAIALTADDTAADSSAKTTSAIIQRPQSETDLAYRLFQFPVPRPGVPYPVLAMESLLPSGLYPRVSSSALLRCPSSLEVFGLRRHHVALLGGAFAAPQPSAFRPASRRLSRSEKTDDTRAHPAARGPTRVSPAAVHHVGRCRAKSSGAPVQRLGPAVGRTGQISSPADTGTEERAGGQPGFGSEGSRTCETETAGEEGSSNHKGKEECKLR